jgi:Protein of unknown function (DUF2568)
VQALGAAVLVVRFGLELAAVAALAYWGFAEHDGWVAVLLGLGAPLGAIVIWWAFVSPKAPLGSPLRQAVFETVVFVAAALALVDARHAGLAIAFAAIALVDGVLVRVTA